MTLTLILQSGLIGLATALVFTVVVSFWRKEPSDRSPKALVKSGTTGFILGGLGCIVSYHALRICSGFIENTLLLLGLVLLISLIFGMAASGVLEKALWARVLRE